MIESIISFLLNRISIDSYKFIKETLLEGGYKLLSKQKDFEKALSIHLKEVFNWANEISLIESNSNKNVSNIYIHLDYYFTPRSISLKDQKRHKILLENLLINGNEHLVFLGHPGAGKTTSMKYVCFKLMTDEHFCENLYNFPILIRLRDLDNELIKLSSSKEEKSILIDHLWRILGLKLKGFNKEEIEERQKKDEDFSQSDLQFLKTSILTELLDELKPLVIFEGFDEIPNYWIRQSVVREFQRLTLKISEAKLILTSRTGEFDNYNISRAKTYEICHLSELQIKSFINKWVANEELAKVLFEQIKNSPFFDTTMRPLNLAHLCAIFERDGEIPDKPKSIYKKVVNLLLEEWSRQNLVKRVSKFSRFEVDRKFDFLSHLAYNLTTKHLTSIFDEEQFVSTYKDIRLNFGLKESQWKEVVREIEFHNGLFIKAGYYKYEFSHKSLQEYLTAEYLIKLPNLPDNKVIIKIPNEVALMIALSSNPSLYLFDIIYYNEDLFSLDNDFLTVFLERLVIERVDYNPCIELAAILIYLHNEFMHFRKSKPKGKKLSAEKMVTDFIKRMITFEGVVQSLKMLKTYYVFNSITKYSKKYQLSLRPNFVRDFKHLPIDLVYHSQIFKAKINED